MFPDELPEIRKFSIDIKSTFVGPIDLLICKIKILFDILIISIYCNVGNNLIRGKFWKSKYLFGLMSKLTKDNLFIGRLHHNP